jgi:uncharacterized protein with PIN domain
VRSSDKPLFIADVMLGSLARWLRILGYDVVYDSRLDDAALVERAVKEKRVILTRDRRLVERKGARTQKSFRECPSCDRVYWRATHVERMLARLETLGLGVDQADSTA